MKFINFFIDFDDRLDRFTFFVTISITTLITFFLIFLVGAFNFPTTLIILFMFIRLLSGLASLSVTVRRLHDLDVSGWVAIILILTKGLPVVYLIIIIGLCIIPGTEGRNKYGNVPVCKFN